MRELAVGIGQPSADVDDVHPMPHAPYVSTIFNGSTTFAIRQWLAVLVESFCGNSVIDFVGVFAVNGVARHVGQVLSFADYRLTIHEGGRVIFH